MYNYSSQTRYRKGTHFTSQVDKQPVFVNDRLQRRYSGGASGEIPPRNFLVHYVPHHGNRTVVALDYLMLRTSRLEKNEPYNGSGGSHV